MLEKLGVESIRLDLPFRLNHVNCFMAESENGWTIIDAGLNNSETRMFWDERIGDRRIETILITHYHPDHFGYAGGLQAKTGAQLRMSEIDAELGNVSWKPEFMDTMPNHYSASGVPRETAEKMMQNTADFQPLVKPLPKVNRFLAEGEQVQIGRYKYDVIHTPGHSDGMVCFYNKEKNVLFSADHILPNITPNISYWFHGQANPLASYLASLEKIKELNADFVIPSHGSPFYGANARIEELMKHHQERLDETKEMIKTPSTVYQICERLFKRPLTVHEMRFAVGETLAHLEFLRHSGECIREKEQCAWFYEQT
ncbi:Hydroxyacylglutathione hydrolase [Planococcus massiliensis]|uniref:Hydroxyacylglutathione hydrolase n=1 Tax=Planococcus massiliensis TaxID=1499687 RepID=A0A098EPD1_9BACL|nr:MBL fold metallo-hydrolase [Planococcus massiliensis]CEG24158.1 Hydroxyacylglutathione hydrolase [Planococcus massiliensis]